MWFTTAGSSALTPHAAFVERLGGGDVLIECSTQCRFPHSCKGLNGGNRCFDLRRGETTLHSCTLFKL